MFDDSGKVGADVILLHGCPQSFMLKPGEDLLQIYEDMVGVLLVLNIFLSEDLKVEDLCGAPSLSEACLFFSNDLLRLRLQFVQYDLQHINFDWMADKVDCSIVVALLQVAFVGECDDQGLGPQGRPFSCLLDLVADCCESGDYILSICLDQFCWDVVDSS